MGSTPTLPHTVYTSRSITFYATFLPFSSSPLITWSTCQRPHPAASRQKPDTLARTTHRERERESFHFGPPLPACLIATQASSVSTSSNRISCPTSTTNHDYQLSAPFQRDAIALRPTISRTALFSRYPPIAHFLLKAWNTPRPGVETNDFTCNNRPTNQSPPWSHHLFITTPPAHILPVECHLALVLEPDPVPSTPQNPHIVNTPRYRRQSGGKRALLHLAQALHPGPDDPLLLVA